MGSGECERRVVGGCVLRGKGEFSGSKAMRRMDGEERRPLYTCLNYYSCLPVLNVRTGTR